MKSRSHLLLGAVLAFSGAGCLDDILGIGADNGADDGADESNTGKTGLAIATAVDTSGETNVAFMAYGIQRVACIEGEEFEPLDREVRVQLESMMLPGGIPAWENSPLDKASEHPFADHFELLPAGCYDLSATPLSADGAPSLDCASAITNDVQVDDGFTTEIFMISQCKGEAVGSIDAVVSLNRPPTLQSLTFSPSKFVKAGEKTTVCVNAVDPNGDPLEIEWDQIGGGLCGSTVISTLKEGDLTTQCADVEPIEAGDYLFEVRVYDLLHDENNKLMRFETWFADHGYPNTSHDALRFPVYVGAAATGDGG